MTAVGGKTWWTAAELAEQKLPGLSTAKRKINELAQSERWALRTDASGLPLARPRIGRGGRALEYHLSVLPPSASAELVRRGLTERGDVMPPVCGDTPTAANDETISSERARLWDWYDQQSDTVKAEAQARLKTIGGIEALEATGLTRTAAVNAMGVQVDAKPSTLWAWLKLVSGVEVADRLPVLAPRRKGGGREAGVDAEAWRVFLSDYLRPERPTLASCYDRVKREYCAPRGLKLPHPKTLARRLEREVDPRVVISRREGADALRATLPHQSRSVADLHALECVNIDGHRWDVFVKWPDGHIARPMMVAIQDVYSRKILAWRIGETESAVLTRLAFADLFKSYGIPKTCLLDNGRAFASKWITGGTANRFRFKIREEEPTGILTALGVQVRWALPFRGSSKPIERAFRDLCDTVAKHPAFAGAYTGNRPDAKPENYGSKAVPLETFRAIATAGIEAHNARPGRRTEACRDRLSFDDAFAASYAVAPIGKATPEQLRLALLAADQVSTDRKSGEIKLFGNRYWSPAMSALAGRKVVVRFDPDHLHQSMFVYGLDGRFLAEAGLVEATGFLDAEGAKRRAKQEGELRKATRRAVDLQQLHNAEDLAALVASIDNAPDPVPSPTVVRPVRMRGNAAALQADTAMATSERWMEAVERMERPGPLSTPSHLRVVE
jgi:putative transposase